MVRSLDDERAYAVARIQVQRHHQVTLLLTQDSVMGQPAFGGAVVTCEEDVLARGGSRDYKTVDYDEIVRMIFEHNRVMSW